MWEALSIIFVAVALFFYIRTRFSKMKKDDTIKEEFVCPSCGSKHCDCYKHAR